MTKEKKRKMKFLKIALLSFVIALSFNSCSIDDNAPNYSFEVIPVESFTVPDSFETGGLYTITLQYRMPTNCHIYSGIYYEKSSDTRVIGITSQVPTGAVCNTAVPELRTATFQFECTPGYQHYVFKFYKGKDDQGNNIFEEVTIPVNY